MRLFLDEAEYFARTESSSFAALLDELHATTGATNDDNGPNDDKHVEDVIRCEDEDAQAEMEDVDGDDELLVDESHAIDLCARIKDYLASEGISTVIFIKHHLPKQTADVDAFMRQPEMCTNATLIARLADFLNDIVSVIFVLLE